MGKMTKEAEQQLKRIGAAEVSIWGGEVITYTINEEKEEVVFDCVEHGEYFNVVLTYDEIQEQLENGVKVRVDGKVGVQKVSMEIKATVVRIAGKDYAPSQILKHNPEYRRTIEPNYLQLMESNLGKVVELTIENKSGRNVYIGDKTGKDTTVRNQEGVTIRSGALKGKWQIRKNR